MPVLVTVSMLFLVLAALGPAFAEPQNGIVGGKRIQPRDDVLAHLPQSRLSKMSEAEIEKLYREVLANSRATTSRGQIQR